MKKNNISFNIAGKETEEGLYKSRRKMIVGPWVNQPKHYQGYNGFVGWAGISQLRTGRWLMAFSSGYWHASPPLTEEILEDDINRKQFEAWHRGGMPYIIAPTGGRAHVMTSDDMGETWTMPEDIIDTDSDERCPPADPPVMHRKSGSPPCSSMFFRIHAIERFTSTMWSGIVAFGLNR